MKPISILDVREVIDAKETHTRQLGIARSPSDKRFAATLGLLRAVPCYHWFGKSVKRSDMGLTGRSYV